MTLPGFGKHVPHQLLLPCFVSRSGILCYIEQPFFFYHLLLTVFSGESRGGYADAESTSSSLSSCVSYKNFLSSILCTGLPPARPKLVFLSVGFILGVIRKLSRETVFFRSSWGKPAISGGAGSSPWDRTARWQGRGPRLAVRELTPWATWYIWFWPKHLLRQPVNRQHLLPGRAGTTPPHWIHLLADREWCPDIVGSTRCRAPWLGAPDQSVLGQERLPCSEAGWMILSLDDWSSRWVSWGPERRVNPKSSPNTASSLLVSSSLEK